MTWLVALWNRVPGPVRSFLAAVVAAVVAGFVIFFRGRRSGQSDSEAEAARERGRDRASQVRQDAAAGDDQAVQDALQRATDEARSVTRP